MGQLAAMAMGSPCVWPKLPCKGADHHTPSPQPFRIAFRCSIGSEVGLVVYNGTCTHCMSRETFAATPSTSPPLWHRTVASGSTCMYRTGAVAPRGTRHYGDSAADPIPPIPPERRCEPRVAWGQGRIRDSRQPRQTSATGNTPMATGPGPPRLFRRPGGCRHWASAHVLCGRTSRAQLSENGKCSVR
jgi:hypothetical protein